jgi:folate-binding protein YgfZ
MGLAFLFEALCAEAQKQGRALASTEYRGAPTVAGFADPQGEFAALSNICGVYDLGYRARILVSGADRVRWLNGMVTNNIRDLAAGRGAYAFLLSPQGRILGDMHVFNAGENLIAETDRNQIEKIMATFDHYIIMDDVELADTGEAQTTLGLAGPKSQEILRGAGIEISQLQPLEMGTPKCGCDCGGIECMVVRGEDAPTETYEIWLAQKDIAQAWQALIKAGARPVGSEALELQRITSGVPLYGVDIRERDLPQETEQARALNFNKGCYIGQEIVERIRSRGNVHRKFAGFLAQAEMKIAGGAKVSADAKEVGEITSVACVNTAVGERIVALGYIRPEAGAPGREVTIGEAKANVVQLPLDVGAIGRADEAVLHRV